MKPWFRSCRAPAAGARALGLGALGAVVLGASLGSIGTVAAAAEAGAAACGQIRHLVNMYGPYDYRTENAKLAVVEQYHFTPRVEALLHGESTYIGGDLSYTLGSSPNHHRALIAVVRFGEKTKSPQPPYLQYSVECYFDRAIRFAPDDTVVRVLYAQYLGKHARKPEALQQLDAAVDLAGDDGFSHYNIGLMYFELGQHERALTEAWRAAALGFERDGLAEELKRVNKWRDPPPEAAAASASAASASASAAAPAPRATFRSRASGVAASAAASAAD